MTGNGHGAMIRGDDRWYLWYLTSLRQGLDETVSARRNSLYPLMNIVVPGAGAGDERAGNVALLSLEE
jgi:hypothetical protein